ncbi:unnamed protein product [Linum tenue]|uniref:Uncharacterized protein n=1 Tax=Linum tenue TaxID=586396 RepID=A0AAV0Q5J7_9ROSI|nr:unnamed protein product [Linum tenue]
MMWMIGLSLTKSWGK